MADGGVAMDQVLDERRRIRPNDALALVLEDLERWAGRLAPGSPEVSSWAQASVDLLAAVPAAEQRVAWALVLAAACPFGPVGHADLAAALVRQAMLVRRG